MADLTEAIEYSIGHDICSTKEWYKFGPASILSVNLCIVDPTK